jgi:hypothetical protein
MNANCSPKSRRFLQRASALAIGVVLAACSASNGDHSAAPPDVPTSTSKAFATTAKDPRIEAWHKTIMDVPVPRDGCFQAAYPGTTWLEVPCVAVPAPAPSAMAPQKALAHAATSGVLDRRTRGSNLGGSVGNDTDWFAQMSGTITQATGSFPNVVGATSPNTYSVQLNSNTFNNATTQALCATAASPSPSCTGWQQVLYSTVAPQTGVYFQYWLLNYASTGCPTSSWTNQGGSCRLNTSSISGVPLAPISELETISVRVVAGSSDALTMTIAGTAYSSSFPTVLGLNQNSWNTTEYGVFGDLNLANAAISSNSTITTKIVTEPASNTATCASSGSGDTGETNSLTLVPHCCLTIDQGSSPGITFMESNVSGQSCSLCGGDGQTCCSDPTGPCSASGDACQLGTCTKKDVLVASPSSLSVQAGDGTTGVNAASTNLEASGAWASNENVAPSLTFGTLPTGVSVDITNDINPPTVQFTANDHAVPGTYGIAITGTIGTYPSVTTNLTLTIGACQPVTCADAGWACGSFDDGCGVTVTCGPNNGVCPSGDECTAGACHPSCTKICPSPEFLDPFTCVCESCKCGTGIVDGHTICKVCAP